MLATVLVADMLDLLLLLVASEFLVELEELVLVAVRAVFRLAALLLLLDLADWAALLLLAVFSAAALREAFVVPVFAVDELEVELLADAPLDASAV